VGHVTVLERGLSLPLDASLVRVLHLDLCALGAQLVKQNLNAVVGEGLAAESAGIHGSAPGRSCATLPATTGRGCASEAPRNRPAPVRGSGASSRSRAAAKKP
jgi:hypothetical protein